MNFDVKKSTGSIIISLLFLSLFSNIKVQVDFLNIRLFYFVTILFFLYFFFLPKSYNEKFLGINYLIPFLIIHVLLSYNLGINNFLRELFQTVVLLFFFYTVKNSHKDIDFNKTFRYLLMSCILIIFITVTWHISNGYYVGWKLLSDTRIVYTLFTILFFLYYQLYNKKKNLTFFLLSLLLFIVLVLSGERKSVAIFIFLFTFSFYRGLGIKSVIILFLIYFLFSISSNYISNPYLKHKIETTLNIMNTGKFNYAYETGKIDDTDTYSNVQRTFSLHISKELISKNPIFGIGTNNYINYVEENYSFLPGFMRWGIHGEFQRVTVENGIVGLFLYLFIWYKSWVRTRFNLDMLVNSKLISKEKSKYILYSIFIPIIFYVGTEASSIRSFILLGVISILPDIINNFKNYHNFLDTNSDKNT